MSPQVVWMKLAASPEHIATAYPHTTTQYNQYDQYPADYSSSVQGEATIARPLGIRSDTPLTRAPLGTTPSSTRGCSGATHHTSFTIAVC